MKNHEKHCTMNPDRECGMCRKIGEDQEPMANLLNILPDLDAVIQSDRDKFGIISELSEDGPRLIDKGIDRLRDATKGCPACMLAAIRQKELVGMHDWDFTAACKEFWSMVNEANDDGAN